MACGLGPSASPGFCLTAPWYTSCALMTPHDLWFLSQFLAFLLHGHAFPGLSLPPNCPFMCCFLHGNAAWTLIQSTWAPRACAPSFSVVLMGRGACHNYLRSFLEQFLTFLSFSQNHFIKLLSDSLPPWGGKIAHYCFDYSGGLITWMFIIPGIIIIALHREVKYYQ